MGLGHLPLVYFCAVRFVDDAVGPAQVVGAIAALLVAAWFYQSRNEQIAPAKVKLTVGATLAVLCVMQGILFQHFLLWMTYPDIAISIGALGTLIFSFVMWNAFGKTWWLCERSSHRESNQSGRGYDRILKVLRTIADLEGAANVEMHHVAEAINNRAFDRRSFG